MFFCRWSSTDKEDGEEFVSSYFLCVCLLRNTRLWASLSSPPTAFSVQRFLTPCPGASVQALRRCHLQEAQISSVPVESLCSQTEVGRSKPNASVGSGAVVRCSLIVMDLRNTKTLKHGGSWEIVYPETGEKTSVLQTCHHYPRYFSGLSQTRVGKLRGGKANMEFPSA